MRVALVSLDQEWENKHLNLLACRSFIQRAKEKNVEIVIFPEMTLTAFSMNTVNTAEDSQTSATVESFKVLAQEFQIAIVFGVVFKDGDKAANNALMIDSVGAIKTSYSKIHPFTFAGEDMAFNGGNVISFAKLGSMTIGLTICYDLRFPEIYSALGKHCDLIINIANWPVKRVDHWYALLKARAIENQIFIVGVNRIGVDGKGFEYIKSSQVINPNGELLKPVASEDEFDIFEVDPEYIGKFKQTFSTTQDRKPALYKSIL
ncbi:MAG: carbon-nitrogen family hydrolase [Gammaproteobacteria bacterium]|nr:carbon-nitrogen family hydrolase [Gammaproteobacteria bacterium]